jgi:lysophospholipase L1-like esterase
MEIGIWGDSIVYGQCDSEGLGWVGRLRKGFPTDDYAGLYNRGICGDTTEDLLKRFVVEAESIEPDTIILAIGINDSKYPVGREENNVSLEEFKKNMQTLLKQARVYSQKILIVGLTKVDESSIQSLSRFTNEQIQIYNNFLKKFSRAEDLHFIEVFNSLDIQTDLYDGLHPNAQGYDKLAKVIGKVFEDVR